MATPSIADWRELAASKRESQMAKIPAEWRIPSSKTTQYSETSTQNVLDIPRTCGILTSRELELTENYDATTLVEMMSSSQVTSVDVVTAFCKRAAVAQQHVNCLTEIFFKEALARARECDEYLAKEGKPMGPLHGLPISLKDSFNVKGTQATIGYISFLKFPPATTNSAIIDILLLAGAVFYCKTNLPQTMMTADSDNNVFGRTLNPYNLSLTSGGSTGGEGALVAMKGSVLGLATDIAGSCRIPALCNGVSSFKPSVGRVPFGGGVPPGRLGSPGSIFPVIGPVGRSVRDYDLLMKTIMDAQPWVFDPNVINVPWRKIEPVTKPLRFGLIRGQPKRPLHPTIARALHSAATHLKGKGHEMVLLDAKIPDLWDNAVLAFKFFSLDPQNIPFKYINEAGEPLIKSLHGSTFPELKGWEPSVDELFDMNMERAKVIKTYHDLFVNEKLDAILMPGYQATAVPHDTYGLPLYTVIQNLLNFPSGILPYLNANKELDAPFVSKDAVYEPPYNPETFEGAPGHVQVMGKPMMDEELMEILKVVESTLKESSEKGTALPN